MKTNLRFWRKFASEMHNAEEYEAGGRVMWVSKQPEPYMHPILWLANSTLFDILSWPSPTLTV